MVGDKGNFIRAMLAFGLAPEEMTEFAIGAIVVAQPKSFVSPNALGLHRFSGADSAAAMPRLSMTHGCVHGLPIICTQPRWRPESVGDCERIWVEVNFREVAA